MPVPVTNSSASPSGWPLTLSGAASAGAPAGAPSPPGAATPVAGAPALPLPAPAGADAPLLPACANTLARPSSPFTWPSSEQASARPTTSTSDIFIAQPFPPLIWRDRITAAAHDRQPRPLICSGHIITGTQQPPAPKLPELAPLRNAV